MGFDYKKEQKEYYSPSTRAHVIFVPQMRFVSVSGEGRADSHEGVYASSCALLRQVAVTLRDAVKAGRECAGFIDYVLPPAELMTWKEGRRAMWKRLYRLPDFFGQDDVEWALSRACSGRIADPGMVRMESISEGMCVQMMCEGRARRRSFDELYAYIASFGYRNDSGPARPVHEIVISPRRTVLRIPIA